MIEYRLIRSDRRTLSISVDREGALVVRAPKRMSRREIEAFLEQKRNWIAQKQALVQQAAQMCPAPEAGAQIPFWGAKKAVHQDGILWLPEGGETASCARKWRLEQAQALITPRVELWAQRTGLRPSVIRYGHAQTRWGSMNGATRSLRLNAALVHCPQDLVDYVIVHELVHLIQPNHSPAVHAAVRSFLPDADSRRKRLRQYGGVLQLWRSS